MEDENEGFILAHLLISFNTQWVILTTGISNTQEQFITESLTQGQNYSNELFIDLK